MTTLAGQRALITGGSRGIGAAIATKFASEGAHVVITFATGSEAAAAVVQEITAAGGTASAVQCDGGDADALEALVPAVVERLGGIDILVNNAGITRDGLMLRMKDADWADVVQVNLTSVFRLCRSALRPMIRQRSGRIINMTSIAGVVGNPGQTNYSAAKAGVIGLTKSLAREVASRSITVNAIAPGFITTDMTAGFSPELHDLATSSVPMERFGTPQEVATAAWFLALPETGYVTGHVLHVDGGLAM